MYAKLEPNRTMGERENDVRMMCRGNIRMHAQSYRHFCQPRRLGYCDGRHRAKQRQTTATTSDAEKTMEKSVEENEMTEREYIYNGCNGTYAAHFRPRIQYRGPAMRMWCGKRERIYYRILGLPMCVLFCAQSLEYQSYVNLTSPGFPLLGVSNHA